MRRMTRTPGTLYLVATPIGNLEDITARAVRVLAEVDLIACEDTRHTRVLLNHYQIEAKTVSYHEHNEQARAEELCEMIEAGASVAVVSDAGTRASMIRATAWCARQSRAACGSCRCRALSVRRGLVASGLPTDEFFFGGFLPARAHAPAPASRSPRAQATLIFYEAPTASPPRSPTRATSSAKGKRRRARVDEAARRDGARAPERTGARFSPKGRAWRDGVGH